MELLDFLQRRRSSKKFGKQAPTREQIDAMLKAGLRVPDHGRLKPYHFVVIEPNKMADFKAHLISAVKELDLGEKGREKAEKLANRAPMVIGVVAKITPDLTKVPEWEQVVTAGCATYAIQLAANAQGFETVWITNKWVNGSALRQAFGCEKQDKIVALILVGAPLDCDEITTASQPEETEGFVRYL